MSSKNTLKHSLLSCTKTRLVSSKRITFGIFAWFRLTRYQPDTCRSSVGESSLILITISRSMQIQFSMFPSQVHLGCTSLLCKKIRLFSSKRTLSLPLLLCKKIRLVSSKRSILGILHRFDVFH